MSTRCQIKVIVDQKEIMLYHHCDGYPEGVGFCLLKLMNKHKQGTSARWIVNDMIKKGDFELTFGNHADIEYYYERDFSKDVVTCMAVDNWSGKMECLQIINLEYNEEKDCQVDEALFKEACND